MLSGLKIQSEVQSGRIVLDPFSSQQVNPNSYNLRLAETLSVYQDRILNIRSPGEIRQFTIPKTGYTLSPNELYLGHTIEIAGSNHYVPFIEGRSSVGRVGMSVHVTAGFGDIGFIGRWTLEITVQKPLIVYPGLEICQIAFTNIIGDFKLYEGRYKDQVGTIKSLGVT